MVKKLPIFFITLYQKFISPMLGNNCRFYPSCSHYAKEAFEVHGFIKGSFLSIIRIFKCGPWHTGGVDMVPKGSAKSCQCEVQHQDSDD